MSPGRISIRLASSSAVARFAASACFGSTRAATRASGLRSRRPRTTRRPMKPGKPVKKISPEGTGGSLGSAERDRHVVAGDDAEVDGVEAVEDASVGAEKAARVLDVEVALDERLEEVAYRRDDRDAQADDQRVGAGEPVLVEDCEGPEGDRASDDAGDQALERLVRGDARRERPPSPCAPAA